MKIYIRGPLLEANLPFWETDPEAGAEIVQWFDPAKIEGGLDKLNSNGNFFDEHVVRNLLMTPATLNDNSPQERKKRKLFLPGTMIALCKIDKVQVRFGNDVNHVYVWDNWDERAKKKLVCYALLLLQANAEDWKQGLSPDQSLGVPRCVCIGGEINLDLLKAHKHSLDYNFTTLTQKKITGVINTKLNASGLAFEGKALFDWQKKTDNEFTPAAFWLSPFFGNPSSENKQLYLSLDLELMRAEKDKWQPSLNRIKKIFEELGDIFKQKEVSENEGELYWTSLQLLKPSSLPKFYWTLALFPTPDIKLNFLPGDWQVHISDQMPAQADVTPRSILTFSPEVEIVTAGNTIQAQFSHAPSGAINTNARYSINAKRNEAYKWTESVEISNVKMGYDAVEVAHILRQQYNLPVPDSEYFVVSPELLWGFVPLSNGWAQLPFLNVSDQEYHAAQLAETESEASNLQEQPLLVGAAVFGNDASETYDAKSGEQAWNVTLLNGKGFSGKWVLDPKRELVERSLTIYEPELILSGFLKLGIQQPSVQDIIPSLDVFMADLKTVLLRSYHRTKPFPSPFQLNFSKISFRNSSKLEKKKNLSFSAPVLEHWAFSYEANDLEAVLYQLLALGLWRKIWKQLLDIDQKRKLLELWNLKPLMWCSHPQTPLIQNLPLTQLQLPPNYPSSSRQLVPFECAVAIREKPALHAHVAAFSVEARVGAKDWPSWVRPQQLSLQEDLIGLSTLSFASLGVPGLIFGPNPDFPLKDNAEMFLPAQLLYSLPYTDEINALTQLPKNENIGAAATIPPQAQKPALIPNRMRYLQHWQQLAALAALAKADADEMLSRGNGQNTVLHLVEPFEWPVKATMDLSKYPGSLTLKNGNANEALDLKGDKALRGINGKFILENERYLRLITASANQENNSKETAKEIEIVAGSMYAYGDGSRLRDQQGFWRGETKAWPNAISPALLKTPMEYAGEGKLLQFDLSTLFARISLLVGSQVEWHFWFRDLPVFVDEKAFIREVTRNYLPTTSLAEDVNDPAAVSAKLNVLTGYEWRIQAEGQGGFGEALRLFEYQFFPLTLEKVEMEGHEVRSIEIIGRIQLPTVQSLQESVPENLRATQKQAREAAELGNVVRLYFGQQNNGMHLMKVSTEQFAQNTLEYSNGIWPLTSEGGVFVPRLHWQRLEYSNENEMFRLSGIHLEFYLFDTRWFISLEDASFKAGSALVLSTKEKAQDLAFVRIERLEVKLSDKMVAEAINITLSFQWGEPEHNLCAGAELIFNLLEVEMVGEKINLMSEVIESRFYWKLKERVYLKIDNEKSSLDHRALQLSFSSADVALNTAELSLLPGFSLSRQNACSGYAACSFQVVPDGERNSQFKVEYACVEAVFECNWGVELGLGRVEDSSSVFGSSSGTVFAGYTLSKASGKWEESLLLNGTLEVKNLISYPLPATGLENGPVTVLFNPNSSELTKTAEKQLNELLEVLQDNPELFISMEGHTGTNGSEDENLTLSHNRVLTVYRYLHNAGLDFSRMSGMWFGETLPIQSNQTLVGAAANRRVEIHPIFRVIPAVHRGKAGAFDHIRHTLRILLNQHQVPAALLKPGDGVTSLLSLGNDGAWQFLATVEHRLADVRFSDVQNFVPVEVSQDRRWTIVQEIRLISPAKLSAFLSGYYHTKEQEHEKVFTAAPAYRSKDELKHPLKFKARELTWSSNGLFSKPLLKHLLSETDGVNEFTRLGNALLVEASTIQKVLSRPVASNNFVNLQYLPNGVQRAMLSVPEDFEMPVINTSQAAADWTLLSLPFLGRLQKTTNDRTGVETAAGELISSLQVDPVLTLFNKIKKDDKPLPLIPLVFASRGDREPIPVKISVFDLSRFRKFKRLDSSSLLESWFRINNPPAEGAVDRDATLQSVTAALPADSPARYGRETMLKRLFDERLDRFPPANGDLLNEDPLPGAALSWRRNALMAGQGFSDLVVDYMKNEEDDKPQNQSILEEKPYSFYFAAAQLHSWKIDNVGKEINRFPAITLIPANLVVAGKANLRPIGLAVSPYLGFEFKVAGDQHAQGALQLVFAELLCTDQTGTSLKPIASKVWQREELAEAGESLAEAWAREIKGRMAEDAAIAILRMRKVVNNSTSLPQIRYDFRVLGGTPTKALTVDGTSPLRLPLGQLRFREGQYNQSPPPTAFSAALFELAPPQVQGVQPLHLEKESAISVNGVWPWGLSAMRFSLGYTGHKTGVLSAQGAKKTRVWWTGVSHNLRFALPPDISDLLPKKFRAKAIPSLLSAPTTLTLPAQLNEVNNGAGHENSWQPLLPGTMNYTILGARAGVPFTFRNFLLSQELSGGVINQQTARATLVSGGIPVQHRYPRPSALPANPVRGKDTSPADALQTWGSYFDINTCINESAPFDNAFVDGSKGAYGLSLTLLTPAGGLLEDTFDGTFFFNAQESSSPFEKKDWMFKAELIASEQSLKLVQKAFNEVENKLANLCFIPEVSSATDSSTEKIRMFLKGLPQGTLLKLKVFAIPPATLLVEKDEETNDLLGYGQTLQFPLRLVYSTLVPEPFQYQFIQFEDPEYNRRLVSQAAQVSSEVAYTNNVAGGALERTEITFAADRLEYNPGSEGMLAIFDAFGNKLRGTVTFILINTTGVMNEITKKEINTVMNFSLSEIQADYSINIIVGDSLLLVYEPTHIDGTDEIDEQWIPLGAVKLQLRVNIVQEPVTPVPTSAYALLKRKQGEISVACARFAWAPKPARIELLNPLDLKTGRVRRRAVYQWTDTIRAGSSFEYGIQKITSSGSTHFDAFQ
jgi:outer membrane protein OmpA-like peptidoglycan-associated protein